MSINVYFSVLLIFFSLSMSYRLKLFLVIYVVFVIAGQAMHCAIWAKPRIIKRNIIKSYKKGTDEDIFCLEMN